MTGALGLVEGEVQCGDSCHEVADCFPDVLEVPPGEFELT